jgi:hypothetical protein
MCEAWGFVSAMVGSEGEVSRSTLFGKGRRSDHWKRFFGAGFTAR